MNRTRSLRMLGALGVATLVVTTVGDGADAAVTEPADDKAPLLWVVKTPAFLDDTTVNGVGYSSDPIVYYTSMTVELQWGAKDPSGICGYSVHAIPAGAPPVALFEDELITSYRVKADEYDGDFGGGSTLTDGWRVTATDCAGNSTESVMIANRPMSVQDDGSSPNAAPGTIAYEGAWAVEACDCSSAGTTHATIEEGAAATYTAEFAKGEHVALVMPVGPDRGRARVYVDGEPISRIDTYADAPGFRRVVWETWMSAGEHTISLVNMATPGRERIDLDAVLQSRRVDPAI